MSFLYGCKLSDDTLSQALDMSSDNRGEPEAVHDHYADDVEILAAAKFRIGNMPGHNSIADTARADRFYDTLDSLLNEMDDSSRKSVQEAIIDLCRQHAAKNFATVQDVKVISADFLIGNIEREFEQWRTVPWWDDYTAMTAGGLCDKPARALGVVRPGDAVTKSFYLLNLDTAAYTVQEIVPSCDCIEATAEALSESDGYKISVTYTADSASGAFSRYVDVVFNEKETPERLTVYGYTK